MIQSIYSINGNIRLPAEVAQRVSTGGVVGESLKPGVKLAVRVEGGFFIIQYRDAEECVEVYYNNEGREVLSVRQKPTPVRERWWLQDWFDRKFPLVPKDKKEHSMPKFVYRCPKGHEFDRIVPKFEGYQTVMCEVPDPEGHTKILDDDGEVIVCGRNARRDPVKSSNPARRNPEHGIQR